MILAIIPYLIIFTVIYFLYNSYFKSYFLLKYYEKQGTRVKFHTGIDFLNNMQDDVEKHHDCVYYQRKFAT